MIKSLVILAGGKGTRLKKHLKSYCKPMLKINNVHFLDILIHNYARFDLDQIIVVAGYRGELIKKKFHNKYFNFVKVKVIVEKKPNGTWLALKKVKNYVDNTFLVVNGDTYIDLNLHECISKIKKKNNTNIFLIKNTNYKSNNLLANLNLKNNRVYYDAKSNLMSSGVIYLTKKIFNYKKNFKSFEKNILETEILKKKVYGFELNSTFLDIGTPKNLKTARTKLKNKLTKPAFFLDRDGVINEDSGYVHSIRDFKLKKGVLLALKKIKQLNFYIFIVTNQAGIAKGLFSIEQFYKFSKEIKNFFLKNNIIIDDVKFCPYHENAKLKKFKKKSNFRKPGNGMIEDLFKHWLVDRKKSFFIGDQITDEKAANRSNLKFRYFHKNLNLTISKLIN